MVFINTKPLLLASKPSKSLDIPEKAGGENSQS